MDMDTVWAWPEGVGPVWVEGGKGRIIGTTVIA